MNRYTPTNTGADGVGYYRGNDGRYYYGDGNPDHMRLTLEEQRLDEERQAAAEAEYKRSMAAQSAQWQAAWRQATAPSPLTRAAENLGLKLGIGVVAVCVVLGILSMAYHFATDNWRVLFAALKSYYAKKKMWFAFWGTVQVIGMALSFVACVLRTFSEKTSQCLLFIVCCALLNTGVKAILWHMMASEISAGTLFSFAFNGVGLAVIPALILLFLGWIAGKMS